MLGYYRSVVYFGRRSFKKISYRSEAAFGGAMIVGGEIKVGVPFWQMVRLWWVFEIIKYRWHLVQAVEAARSNRMFLTFATQPRSMLCGRHDIYFSLNVLFNWSTLRQKVEDC